MEAAVGDKIKVGGLIAVINEKSVNESGKSAGAPAEAKSAKKEKPAEAKAAAPPEPEPEEKTPDPAPRKTKTPKSAPPSSPSAKLLARELGIDISNIQGTGARGRVSSEDVRTQAKDLIHTMMDDGSSDLPDFSPWGKIDRTPVSTVGKISAQRLSRSWKTVPHVTHHDSADITELEALRKSFSARAEKAGGKLTVTAIMVKVVASALGAFPKFNGSFDSERRELVFKDYINIGIAVDTERGLLLPVIKNADEKNIIEISIELADLAKRTREKNIKPDELQGSSFSVSNLGGIGGDSFTPIVNFPEVAILGLSRSKMRPVYDEKSEQFKPRMILPLSLSYDHRMIDGAEAARFVRWVSEAVEEPFKLVFEG
ncbi:2-oxo acid dehydrogenase subunit E2 [Candidatus Mycalebacterium sp.]